MGRAGLFIRACIVLLFLSACSGGGGGNAPSPGITSTLPSVTSTSPALGATDVAIDTVITAAFSKDRDAATINGTTFTLDNGVTGGVTYDAANRVAAFTPSTGLANNTTCTATINDAAVTYGTPVFVTAGNGETQSYTDCTALNQAGAACLP